jgi:hypothetical protein
MFYVDSVADDRAAADAGGSRRVDKMIVKKAWL